MGTQYGKLERGMGLVGHTTTVDNFKLTCPLRVTNKVCTQTPSQRGGKGLALLGCFLVMLTLEFTSWTTNQIAG